MRLCRVLGSVTQSVKHPTYLGHKLLVVQPITPEGQDDGSSFLAVDRAQAGAGDRVLVMSEGNGVRQLLGLEQAPIRSLIVGVVDQVDLAAPGSGARG